MAYVLEMVSRGGSLLKIIMISLLLSSRSSDEEEVEGMTCDLMAIAGGRGGRSTYMIHSS